MWQFVGILFVLVLLMLGVGIWGVSQMGDPMPLPSQVHHAKLEKITKIHQFDVPANSTIVYSSKQNEIVSAASAVANHWVQSVKFHSPIKWQNYAVQEMGFPDFRNLYFQFGVGLTIRPTEFHIKNQYFECVKDERNGRLLFRYAKRADRFNGVSLRTWQPEAYEFAGCEFADKVLVKLENKPYYFNQVGILASDSHDPIRAHIYEKVDGDSFYWLIENTQSGAIREDAQFYLSHIYLNRQHEFQGLSGIFRQNRVYQNCTYGNLIAVDIRKIAPNQYEWTFGRGDDRPAQCNQLIMNHQAVAELLNTGSLKAEK